MRRAAAIVTLSGALLLLTHPTPAKGGGSMLEPERWAYAVGEIAVAREAFSGTGYLRGTVSDGPYYAYLVPGDRSFQTPGPIPRRAIPLGPIRIAPGGPYGLVAHLQFRIPNVPTGLYSIEYCNDPCSVNGIGDLVGGSFLIGQTVAEARAVWRADQLAGKVRRLTRDVRIYQEDNERLEASLESWSGVMHQNRRLQDVISELEAQVPARAVPPPRRPLVPGWAIAVASAVLLGSAVLLRRRRRFPAVPDVVPPELVDEHREAEPIRN